MLNNTLAAIEDGRASLMAFLEPDPIGARALNAIDVIFEELVSNAVRHGFEPGSPQSVRVIVRRREGFIDLVFEDDGVAFDPLTAPRPQALTSIESAPLGGLGIEMVRRLSASLSYTAVAGAPDEGTQDGFSPRNQVAVSVRT